MPEPASLFPASPPPPNAQRRGNPNLHLAPRCGARTRSGCPCRAPAIRGKARCRMHGGRSTGPRTPEGRQRLRTARLAQGARSAEFRAREFFVCTWCRYGRLQRAVMDCRHWLPPALARRVSPWLPFPPELEKPAFTPGGMTVAEERARRRQQEMTLGPWRRAIAEARRARRNARHAGAAGRDAGTMPAAARAVQPDGGPPPPGSVREISAPEPHAPEQAAGSMAATAAGAAHENPAPGRHAPEKAGIAPPPLVMPGSGAGEISAPGPHAPEAARAAPASAATPAPGAHVIPAMEPHAPDRIRATPATDVAPARGADENLAAKPHAPAAPSGPAPGLDRRARRHWKWQQRQLRKGWQANQSWPPERHGDRIEHTSAMVERAPPPWPPRPLRYNPDSMPEGGQPPCRPGAGTSRNCRRAT